jgi:hypothetical protein
LIATTRRAPEAVEIAIPLVLWPWAFEIVLPQTGMFGGYCVADHRDILRYAAGPLVAAASWRWWYGDGMSLDPAASDPTESS